MGRLPVRLVVLRHGAQVPYGEGHRYDLAFDHDGKLARVQCKTGHLENGAVVFKTASYTHNVAKSYHGEADFFGVYCQETSETCLVPIKDVHDRLAHLRVQEPKNGQTHSIRWARDYVL
jgi:PD-(D/E)XK endonuclease